MAIQYNMASSENLCTQLTYRLRRLYFVVYACTYFYVIMINDKGGYQFNRKKAGVHESAERCRKEGMLYLYYNLWQWHT